MWRSQDDSYNQGETQTLSLPGTNIGCPLVHLGLLRAAEEGGGVGHPDGRESHSVSGASRVCPCDFCSSSVCLLPLGS